MPTAIVVGVGPGLGAALARRFARGGCDVVLMARSEANLAPVAKEVEALGRRAVSITVDAGSAPSVSSAFARAKAEAGAADGLVYNAGVFKMASLLDLSPEDFESCLRINCTGGFLAS